MLLFAIPASAEPTSWPELPTSGFVSGRPATISDAEAGNAVFVAQVDGKATGEPLTIEIPQFAYLLDAESGERTPVVIVQAEKANGIELVGYRDLAGTSEGVATLQELELLGVLPPS